MMVQAPKEVGEIPTDAQDTPILTQPSSSQPQRKDKTRRKQRKETKKNRTHRLKRLYKVGLSTRIVSSDEEGLGDQEDASKQGRSIDNIDQDKGVTLVDDTQGRMNEEDLFKAMMDADYELAAKLQEEERGELSIKEKSNLFVELINKRKKHSEKLRAEERRRKPLTKAQKRKQMSIDSEAVNERTVESSKRVGEELEQESAKKQKLDEQVQAIVDNDDIVELKGCLEIVPKDDDDVTIEATSLSSKYPTIIDYKIYKEEKTTLKSSGQMETHKTI
nr:hypothetical protein [Tanacetum cinerariifolium]